MPRPTMLSAFLLGTLCACQQTPSAADGALKAAAAAPQYGQITKVCAGQILPSPWVWINTETNLAMCSQMQDDIVVFKNLGGAPDGTTETVCAGAQLPSGWATVNYQTQFGRCGSSSNFQNNLWVIRYNKP